ncbi:MAG: SH3 domain-containing protein [Symploca sp. SIO2G7]|nr:SH3 domain-containing protein [Symploca sp. SIO2G7]
MVSQRFTPQNFLVGLTKFICGIAIALLTVSLASVATARYFLTQLSTLPERPVYDNDASAQIDNIEPTEQKAAEPDQAAANKPETKALYKAAVTYGAGLLVRTGAGAEYETIDGIDYDETVEVLEESDRWFRVRTSNGVEGWIKGRDNTRQL